MTDHTIRLACDTYRYDLAWVRKDLALGRAGSDLRVRVECGIPGADASSWIDVILRRGDVYLIGLANSHVGFRFSDTNPIVAGVDFTRKLPFEPNYSILGAWHVDPNSKDQGFTYKSIYEFHNAVATLAKVTQNSNFGPAEARALILMIFTVSEALRFWTLAQAIEKVICDTSGGESFRLLDWKDTVNNWDSLSGGEQQGALHGVILPSV